MAFFAAGARVLASVVPRVSGAASKVGNVASKTPKVGAKSAGPAAPKAPGGTVPKTEVGEQPLMSSMNHNGKVLLDTQPGKVAVPTKPAAPAAPAHPATVEAPAAGKAPVGDKAAAPTVGEKAAAPEVGAKSEAATVGKTDVGKTDVGKTDVGKTDVGKSDVVEGAAEAAAAPAKSTWMDRAGQLSTIGGLGMMGMELPSMFKGGEAAEAPPAIPTPAASHQALSDPGYMPAYGNPTISAPMMGGVTSPGNIPTGGMQPRPMPMPTLLPPGVVAPMNIPMNGPRL